MVCLVIILFIGISVAPSVTSIDISKTKTPYNGDLVEITLQLCKTDGVEDHKMFITQEQDEQLDSLIESFKADLDKAETREETIEIYNDMVVSLDELGILPESTNCKEVQELVTGENSICNPEKMKSIKQFNQAYEKLKNKNPGLFEDTNMFCLISVETDETEIIPSPSSIFIFLILLRAVPLGVLYVILETLYYNLELDYEPNLLGVLGASLYLRLLFWYGISKSINFIPLNLGGLITFGYEYWDHWELRFNYVPAEGWVHTYGLFGIKNWNEYVYGDISVIASFTHLFILLGVVGFTGIKINNFYQGTALWVKLSSNSPE